MTTRVGFLRAVNVGRRRVDNARLVQVTEGLGHRDVWTYVNSGNIVFDGAGRRAVIERDLAAAIEADVGFEVTTFVRTEKELRATLDLAPFEVADGDTYFVTFLADRPTASQAAALEGLSGRFDTLVVDGRDVHWRMHGRSTDTELTTRRWEEIVGRHASTSRNTTMLTRLAAKLAAR